MSIHLLTILVLISVLDAASHKNKKTDKCLRNKYGLSKLMN